MQFFVENDKKGLSWRKMEDFIETDKERLLCRKIPDSIEADKLKHVAYLLFSIYEYASARK